MVNAKLKLLLLHSLAKCHMTAAANAIKYTGRYRPLENVELNDQVERLLISRQYVVLPH